MRSAHRSTPPAERRPLVALVAFFVLTLAATWLCYLPVILAARGVISVRADDQALLRLFGILAPTLTAFAVVSVTAGRRGAAQLWKSAGRWRFGLRWYAVVLLAPFVVAVAAVALTRPVSGADAWFVAPTAAAAVSSITAPLGEEFGWRGYALPRLQRRLSPLAAGVVLGLIWAVWHLPMAFVPGTTQHDAPFAVFTMMIVGASLLFVWVAAHTGGSVLAALLLHGAANLSFNTVPVFFRYTGDQWATVVLAVLYLVIGLVLVLRMQTGSDRPDTER